MDQIEGYRRQVADGANPRDIKFLLGEELVDRFHGAGRGAQAREAFVARFQKGALPDELPVVELDGGDGLAVGNLLKEAGLTGSTSEALRMIKQGAVRIDGERLEDPKRVIDAGGEHVVQVGKRRVARVLVR